MTQKSPSEHHPTTLSGYIFTTDSCIDNRKNLLSINISSRCPHNMVNFGLLATEIISGVWGTPATFNGFRVFAALLHGSQVVSVNQTLRRWTEGATYVRQGDHYVGHWPTFLVLSIFFFFSSPNLSGHRLDVYHTSTHGVALVRIYHGGLKCAARGSLQVQDAKKSP